MQCSRLTVSAFAFRRGRELETGRNAAQRRPFQHNGAAIDFGQIGRTPRCSTPSRVAGRDPQREMRLEYVQIRELTRFLLRQVDDGVPLRELNGYVENLDRRLNGRRSPARRRRGRSTHRRRCRRFHAAAASRRADSEGRVQPHCCRSGGGESSWMASF